MTQKRPDLASLLIEKANREAALLAEPENPLAQQSYLHSIENLGQNRTGLIHALLPTLGQPLILRAGTADLAALRRVATGERLGWLTDAAPRRILDIGAHAGFVAAHLATRFPDAAILCVEPDADTHRILTLNTAAHPQIRRTTRAAWHSATRLAPIGFDSDGLGPVLADTATPGADLPAAPVATLLAEAGMPSADLVLCDTAGAEAAIFADPRADWLAQVDIAAIDIREDQHPGTEALVAACFPAPVFTRARHGRTTLFRRAHPPPPPPARLALLHSAPGLLAFSLHDVPPIPGGFTVFGGDSCQLHPNAPGGPPASIRFVRTLTGQTRLACLIRHAGRLSPPIQFAITLATRDGTPLARAVHTLAAGDTAPLDLTLPTGLSGPHRVVLETAMMPGAPHNHAAWAQFLSPALL